MHSNGILDFDVNACASQYFTSSSTIIEPEKPKGAGCNGAGVNRPNQPITLPPLWNIRADFYSNSEYILGAIDNQAGKVYNGSTGQIIHNTQSSGGDWLVGWFVKMELGLGRYEMRSRRRYSSYRHLLFRR